MSLRNQPYLPLYVQDFLSDEKLIECSAAAHGVYIRLICNLHKSERYGTILLKQKYKQSTKQVLNFAAQLAKIFPFDLLTVQNGLAELVEEGVLIIEGDLLIQKRMVKDNEISEKRATAGRKGGKSTTEKNKKNTNNFAQAKVQANTEYEYEYTNEDVIEEEVKEGLETIRRKPLSEKASKVLDALKEKFGIDELKNFNQFRELNTFVETLNHRDKIEHFIEQYKSYWSYKEISQETTHGFKAFLGDSQNHYETGGWNAENWTHKLNNFKPKSNGKLTTIEKRDKLSKNRRDAIARHYVDRLKDEERRGGV